MSDDLTLDLVRRTAEQIATETPGRVNPLLSPEDGPLESGCAYVGPSGEHCFGGEVLVRLGVLGDDELRDYESASISSIAEELSLEPEVVEYLADLQALADGYEPACDSLKAAPRPWGEVIRRLRERA